MAEWVERLQKAHQAGVDERNRRMKEQQAQEDRDFELKKRAAQLKIDTINEQMLKRKLEQENAAALQGAVAPTTAKASPMSYPGQLGEGPSLGGEAIPFPSQVISGVPELGVSGYSQPITSMQQKLELQKMAEADAFLKQINTPYTLNPGDIRFAGGKQVASNPKPETPLPNPPQPTADIQKYQLYAQQEIAEGRKPINLDAWLQREATRRPAGLAPVVIQTPTGPQVVDRQTQTAKPITSAGETVGLVPTTEQRNRVAARKTVQPVLNRISDLSEKINTQAGLIAKISGAVEKAKAKANYDDDVATYQALISGFTPLVARALGHTGVLTEQDVQSVKELFPKPGDSKSLRDRKIDQVITLIEAVQGTATGPETKVVNGVTYEKVEGGWRRQQPQK